MPTPREKVESGPGLSFPRMDAVSLAAQRRFAQGGASGAIVLVIRFLVRGFSCICACFVSVAVHSVSVLS